MALHEFQRSLQMSEKKIDNGMGETETLLDYVEVGGYKIKPWGIVELSELSPHLEKVFKNLKERGVTLEGSKEGVGIDRVIFSFLPVAADILTVTLRITRAELEKIPVDKLPVIMLTIVKVNLAYLKNWLGLVQGTVKKITT
jgi:hypothetical protein